MELDYGVTKTAATSSTSSSRHDLGTRETVSPFLLALRNPEDGVGQVRNADVAPAAKRPDRKAFPKDAPATGRVAEAEVAGGLLEADEGAGGDAFDDLRGWQ